MAQQLFKWTHNAQSNRHRLQTHVSPCCWPNIRSIACCSPPNDTALAYARDLKTEITVPFLRSHRQTLYRKILRGAVGRSAWRTRKHLAHDMIPFVRDLFVLPDCRSSPEATFRRSGNRAGKHRKSYGVGKKALCNLIRISATHCSSRQKKLMLRLCKDSSSSWKDILRIVLIILHSHSSSLLSPIAK